MPATWIMSRQHCTEKRERQGEQRVAELHQIKIFANSDDLQLLCD
jgi:hypothetical protein